MGFVAYKDTYLRWKGFVWGMDNSEELLSSPTHLYYVKEVPSLSYSMDSTVKIFFKVFLWIFGPRHLRIENEISLIRNVG